MQDSSADTSLKTSMVQHIIFTKDARNVALNGESEDLNINNMKKKLTILWYYITTDSMYNYRINKTLDEYLNEGIKSGINICKSEHYHISILFNNEMILENGWNANKYYAWLQMGSILFPDNVNNIKWYDERPSKMTMCKLRYDIKQYRKNNNN